MVTSSLSQPPCVLYGQTACLSTGMKSLTETEKVSVHLQKKLIFRVALLGLKTSPVMLKSLSQAAGAGRGVCSFTESLHPAGKDFSKSM